MRTVGADSKLNPTQPLAPRSEHRNVTDANNTPLAATLIDAKCQQRHADGAAHRCTPLIRDLRERSRVDYVHRT